jgi:MoxR-like ATPase
MLKEVFDGLDKNVSTVIKGKTEVLKKVITAFLSDGHVLLEDVPGVGKTMMARAIAISLGIDFKRVQATPDLLPTDITGLNIFDRKKEEFVFHKGPIFTDILLVDEINRTTPKTQAALLEAMAESQVTVDGKTYKMTNNFFVIATQNPIEYEGTFPLPEAQVDRFFMKISMGYPNKEEEVQVLKSQRTSHPINSIKRLDIDFDITSLKDEVRNVRVDDTIYDYVVEIINRTRSYDALYLGASPRGSLALIQSSKAVAAINGRNYVIPDDIKFSVKEVLAHRLILKPETKLKRITAYDILDDIINDIKIPYVDKS